MTYVAYLAPFAFQKRLPEAAAVAMYKMLRREMAGIGLFLAGTRQCRTKGLITPRLWGATRCITAQISRCLSPSHPRASPLNNFRSSAARSLNLLPNISRQSLAAPPFLHRSYD